MFTLFFSAKKVVDYQTALQSDTQRFARYFNEMLARGVYLAPSQYEAAFISTAHSDEEIEKTLHAAQESLVAAFSA